VTADQKIAGSTSPEMLRTLASSIPIVIVPG